MTESGISPNAVELPCDCELPSHGPTLTQPSAVCVRAEAPAVADVGHLPRRLYGLTCRPRWQIIRDYARDHNLTVAEIDALVKSLPDYGLRAQLHGSLALITARPGVVVSMAAERHRRRV